MSHAEDASSHSGPEPNFYQASHGIKSWLFTLDHKRIGIMYLCGIIVAFLIGGFFAMLIRVELFTPGKTIVGPQVYNSFFTLHGSIMVFLVIIPGIPAALGNIILPMQLGAPDVAFPRLNLTSLYLWYIGAALLLVTLGAPLVEHLLVMTHVVSATGHQEWVQHWMNAVDTGWTFYTPYSTTTSTVVLPVIMGAFILGFSSIFTGLNFIVTVHKFRRKAMSWFKMPLNIWGLYATAIIQVLATPVLGITLLLLFCERWFGIGIFNPTLGGDPILFQHFFWFYSHPAVYIMILPAMGVVNELITTFSQKPIFGYRFIAYSSVALAILSFFVWGHHLFVSGQSPLATMVFSALTFSVAIPSAVKVFNWIATMYKGSIRLTTPMIYALMFILLFTIGGLTGLFLGSLSLDVHLTDTYFVVAHFHYVMMGSALIAFLGGLHFWWPKFTGRMYNDKVSRVLAIIIFFAFNLTFLPQFILGSRGMPRRYWDYDPRFTTLHQVSSIGAFILGMTLFLSFVVLLVSLKRGKKAPPNPWGASGLEWDAPSPPPLYNFTEPPVVRPPYQYDDLVYVSEEEGWVRRPASKPESEPQTAGAAGGDGGAE